MKFAIYDGEKLKMYSPSHANYLWPFLLHLQQLAADTAPGTLGFPRSTLRRTAADWPGRDVLQCSIPSAGVCWAGSGLFCIWLRRPC